MSGWLANPTPHTGNEPNFNSNMNEEHTPINLPDSHRSFPCRDDATIISTLCGSRRFSAFRSIQQRQTNRSKQGSHNVRIFSKVLASGNSGGIMSWLKVVLKSRKQVQIWTENVLPTIFSSQSKEKTRSRSQATLCIRSEKEKISTKSVNGKLIRPSEER